MFKMTFTKIKKLCSVALIPRILRDEVTLSPRKLGKRPLDGFWKMAKSTDSKDRAAECEKCKKIIEMVFGCEKPDTLLKQVEANIEDIQLDKIQKVITPNITVHAKMNEKNKLISVINTGKELQSVEKVPDKTLNQSLSKNPRNQAVLPLNNTLQSTSAKTTEEQLTQKLETIEDPGLVETAVPKIDGFNTPPKVLGGQENLSDNKNSLCMKIGPEEEAMDEIAKKCLSSPPDKIDERILEEMKNCGMLGRGRKKSTSRKSGYHAMKCNEKETLSETKSEQSAIYCKSQDKPSIHDYPPMRYHKMKFDHSPQNIYPAYFKNVPFHLIGDGQLDRKTEVQKGTPINQKQENTPKTTVDQEKSMAIFSENSAVIGSWEKSSVINNTVSNKTNVSKEIRTNAIANEEEKPKEVVGNVEAEVEEIRVSAAETSRLGIPGETEIDPDCDKKNSQPEILTCNKIAETAEANMKEQMFDLNKNENTVFANTRHPTDWHYRPDQPDRPFTNPNTSISSTYPTPDLKADLETLSTDTAISSRQNPAEYFDLSDCKMEKVVNDNVISLSEIRPIAAYHQYTIITGSDETEESETILFSPKNTPEVFLPELKLDPQIKEQETPKSINKDISAAIGPLPQLKDMEKEISLTEMLRRVRERNRLQLFRECAYKALEAEPVEANKCPPPLDKGPAKTLGPGPCKPKPKPACPPPPPACPPPASPCKPKDPCAKFTETSIIGYKIKETFSLVLKLACKPDFPSPSSSYNDKINETEPFKKVLNIEDANRIEKLASFLLSNCPGRKPNQFVNDDITLARDYEPWSPIPSWPIPKKEKKEPFVCPKEGCKIIPPPRLNSPCKENPCINLPKRTFSLIEFEYEPSFLYDK